MRFLWTLSLLLACVQAPKHPGDGIPVDLGAGQDSGATADTAVESTGDTAGASDTGPVDQGGELRGIWVTRWTYSTAGDVAEIMAAIADAGFNTVFFQVRGRHDAYYASTIEPWAQRLSGTHGVHPGWDPLETAVSEGHARGLQVHAYLNVFPLWSGETPPASSSPSHAYLSNPEWLVADVEGMPMALNSSYVFASPGNPEVRARIAAVSADVASRYAVDGIHLDYIRYPGSGYSHDMESLYRWEAAGEPDWEQWQRAQVTATVQGVSDAVDIPVTAAVWGIYENSFGWSGVSQGNQDYFQDSRAFLSTGALDANIPMIYWSVADEEGAYLDFRVLVRDHLSHASGRHIYAGISAAPSIGQSGVIRCIEVAREEGAHGVVLFDYSQALPFFDALKSSVFSEPADPPAMLWR
jgi:uncharacterized lipoprotein YddW (UPF0748 family)